MSRNFDKFNIIILIFAVLFSMLSLEIFLRIFKKNDPRGTLRISDPLVNHKLRANVAFDTEWKRGEKIRYFTNSLGFRDGLIRNIASESDGMRILFLGDSFTEGVGVLYSDTFVAKFRNLLRNGGIDGDTLNAGTVSYSPLLEYLRLDKLLDDNIKFDLVVLMLDISDVQDEVGYEQFDGNRGASSLFRFKLYPLYNNSFAFRFIWNGLSQIKRDMRSNAKTTGLPQGATYYEERALFTEDVDIYKRWGRRGVFLVKRDLGRIKSLLDIYGIPFVVVIYPWKTQIESKIKPSIFETEMMDYCKSMDISIISLFADFRDNRRWKELFIQGDVHWNIPGHSFVAEELYRHIKNMRIIKEL